MIISHHLAAIINCNNPETYLLILFTPINLSILLGLFSMHHVFFPFFFPNLSLSCHSSCELSLLRNLLPHTCPNIPGLCHPAELCILNIIAGNSENDKRISNSGTGSAWGHKMVHLKNSISQYCCSQRWEGCTQVSKSNSYCRGVLFYSKI